MNKKQLDAILIGKDAHRYLEEANSLRKGYGFLTDEQAERRWQRCYKVRGKCLVTAKSYGDEKSGRWHWWTIKEIKDRLDEVGLKYEDTDPIESISL